MDIASSLVKDVSVLRRMLFASTYFSCDMPHYWEVVASFSNQGNNENVSASQVKLLMENLEILNQQAFSSDLVLTRELLSTKMSLSQPLEVVLVSAKKTCRSCGTKLLLRGYRSSRITLYTEELATVPATHYHKYCGNEKSTEVQTLGTI